MDLTQLNKFDFKDDKFDELVKFVSKIKDAKVDEPAHIPMTQLMGLRSDRVEPSLPRDKVFMNAPNHNGEYFIVPKVVE